MSFFISDNLKGLIDEDDLFEKEELINVGILISDEVFSLIFFENKKDQYTCRLILDTHELNKLFKYNNSQVNISLVINSQSHYIGNGELSIVVIDVNNNDNLLTSQIVIQCLGDKNV